MRRRAGERTYDPDTLRFARPVTFIIDTELGILHLPGCKDKSIQIAHRYRYSREVRIWNRKEARELDAKYKVCNSCKERAKQKRGSRRTKKVTNKPDGADFV